jgi:hypothetical protein
VGGPPAAWQYARLSFLLLALARVAAAQEPATPSHATVFIRVVGAVRAEYQGAWKETIEETDVEIATGSGFVVSPAGYVLTSHHVVSGDDLTLQRHGQPVRVKLDVKRVEVVLPADGTHLEARVEASDPGLDLAVLSVSAHDLPFVGLGDSDALEPGQPVEVIGYPYGRSIEVGRAASADTVPQPSVSRGSVAALRAGDEGEARYIQTDAAIYPGNSGGPMLDEGGYAVGVVKMVLTRRSAGGSGPAFAVPINRAKDFLQSSGLERVFAAPRLRLGPVQSFDWKRIRFRLPDGFDDSSPSRLRIEWMPSEVSLRVERVASPLALSEVEARLLAGRDFAGGAIDRRAARPLKLGGRLALAGRGRAVTSSGAPADVAYAIVDLGREKVVARYVGPPGEVAFNQSVLDGWLASVEADPLLTAEVRAPVPAPLEAAALPHPDAPALVMPQGWYREPDGHSACGGLPAPDSVLSAFPEGDFTISLTAAWWRLPVAGLERALASCPGPRPPDAPASYAGQSSRLGVTYAVQGVFLPAGGGLLQLETESPVSKEASVRDIFATWMRTITAPEPR